MTEFLLRFLIGGAVVSLFAAMGDVLRPKSFAGLFGAAPSVALATLSLTLHGNGRAYAAQEASTMLLGASAFLVYAALASLVLRRERFGALATSVFLMPVWFGLSLGLLFVVSGRP